MSRKEKMEMVLAKAKALEKKYVWLKAIDFYEQALGTVGKEDVLKRGQIHHEPKDLLH